MAEENAAPAGDESQTKQKIVKQIEYYFGDLNLMRDKFLKEKIQEDDGWVTIETMLKFNRLRQISEDENLVKNALIESKSELMEVHETENKIRRNPSKPLPDDTKERRDELQGRTFYAKGFPLDVTLDELMTFFEGYGSVETVFMKREFHKKTFKGSVFVTFAKKEDGDKFVAEKETKYKDTELESKKSKTDYFKDKNLQKRKEGKPNVQQQSQDSGKAEIQHQTNEEKAKLQMTKNAVLYFEGIDPETPREDIKNFFNDFGVVGWVDYDKGDSQGYLRFKEPNSAAPAFEKAKEAGGGKIVLNDKELTVRVVEGEEELTYWTKMFKDIAEKNKQKKAFRGDRRQGGRNQRGGRRNRGGPQGKRKRDEEAGDAGGDEDGSEEPVVKAAKEDTTPKEDAKAE